MQTSSQPKLLPIPFADAGSKQDIPNDSQVGIAAGRASYNDGFPPLTRTPLAAGGVPPFGTDFNGVLNDITAAIRWSQAGACYPFNTAFNSAVSGYPKGARIPNSSLDGFWLNTVDGNTTNPENTTAAITGWVPSDNYGSTAITGLAGTAVTLTTLQASKYRITLAGVLSANINLTIPAWQKTWMIENNCTGSFSITIKTPSGTGVAIPAGMKASVYGNGTNIILDNPTQNVSTQVTGTISQSRNLNMSVTAASATATITADEIIVGTAIGGSQYRIGNFSKAINLGTTGAGGMDTGTAPANGYVAIYAIYNQVTAASALLAVNATSAVAPEVYGGANMPAGFTASALVSVWRTSSSQFVLGYQQDRNISIVRTNVLQTSTNVSSSTALSMSGLIPLNGKSVDLILNSTQTTGGSGIGLIAQSSTTGISYIGNTAVASSGTSASYVSGSIPIITLQTIYYYMVTTNPGSYVISLGKYTI